MEIEDLKKIHELINNDRWTEGANQILKLAGQTLRVESKPQAIKVCRKLFQNLLDNELYLHAATLQWGPEIFNSGPESVVREFKAMHEGSMLLFMGASSMGKCLGKNTPVLMYDGSIKMSQDIKVGDRLMGDDSKPRNVLVTSSGRSKLYKIIPERGDPWVCNDAHILSLRVSSNKICGGSRKPSKKTFKGNVLDVPIEEYLGYSRSRKNILKQFSVGVEFKSSDVPYDPYVYGSWIGDGGTDVPSLHTPDGPMARRWCEYFESIGFRISSGYHEKCPMWCVRVASNGKSGGGRPNPFLDFIRTSVRDGEKFIRQDYLVNSREVRLKLLAGLIDSDGWVQGSSYGFVSKFENLAKQVAWLARGLGYAATVNPRTKRIRSIGFSGTYYHVHISGRGISDIPTLEKRAKEPTSNKNLCNTGFRIEDLGCGEYFGFVIDGNHRFLLGDFTVTHNTYGVGAWYLLDYLRDPYFTTVKLAAVNEDHLRKNLFAHVATLLRNCAIPPEHKIDIRDSDLWIGIKEAGNEFGISGIAFKQSQETSGQFKGYKAKPVRKSPHPKFGFMSRLRVLGDEGQNWPGGPFKDFNSLIASKTGSELIKVAVAFNPESLSSHVVQLAEPEHGWSLDDLDSLYDWESKAGWRVCRLDAARSENVIQKKIVYAGLQTYDGFIAFLKAGGDSSANFYCADTETEVMSDRGWLSHNELNVGDRIYTVNPKTGLASFEVVEEVFRKHYDGNLTSMEGRGFSALVTNNHRWAISDKGRLKRAASDRLVFKETKYLKPYDLIPLCAQAADLPEHDHYGPDFCELVGWVVSDGTFQELDYKRAGSKVCINQSILANPEKCERIRKLLHRLKINAWEQVFNGIKFFNFSGEFAHRVRAVVSKDKKLDWAFINSLTEASLRGLYEGMLLGDGGFQGGATRYFCQRDEFVASQFSYICARLGMATTSHKRHLKTKFGECDMTYVNVRKSLMTRPGNMLIGQSPYSGIVWCPRTKNGTFYARRRGTSYFTGNTFARGWPPLKGAINTIVPPAWPQSQRGEATFIDVPVTIGAVDLAFMGQDSAQMAVGRWGLASGWRDHAGKFHVFQDRLNPGRAKPRHVLQVDQLLPMQKHDDTVRMAEEIIGNAKMLGIRPEWIGVDKTSIGLGTYSHLARYWGDVFGISWNEKATERKILTEDTVGADKQCDGVSSEMWWAFRRWLDPQCNAILINPIIPPQPINTQFTTRRYSTGAKGIKVESKEVYKARNQNSPDEADAIIMLVHVVRGRSDVLPGTVEQLEPVAVGHELGLQRVGDMKPIDSDDSICADGEDE